MECLASIEVGGIQRIPADEAAVRILVEAILKRQTHVAQFHQLRSRGLHATFTNLPSVLKHLHYRTDAEALAVVVDSDKSSVHLPNHNQPGNRDLNCRLCQLREVADATQKSLRPVEGRLPVKLAFGLTVPSIEAWFRCGLDAHVTEASWIQALQSNSYPFTLRSLKLKVYGTDVPGLSLETTRAVEASERLAQNLELLESFFPNGFGALVNDVRSW